MKSSTMRDRIASVAALADPSRRAVYDYVRREGEVSRDTVAEALGMVRGTAAFHLDRLAGERLLTVSYRRLTGRTGPGSGRPTKIYAPAEQEVSASVPDRRYDLAGELMAAAIEDSIRTGGPIADSLSRTAAAGGRSAAAGSGSLQEALERCGYEPSAEADGGIVLRNCPFHRLAKDHTDTVCGMNLHFLGALVDRPEEAGRRVLLDPVPGRCCVRILPPQQPGSGGSASSSV